MDRRFRPASWSRWDPSPSLFSHRIRVFSCPGGKHQGPTDHGSVGEIRRSAERDLSNFKREGPLRCGALIGVTTFAYPSQIFLVNLCQTNPEGIESFLASIYPSICDDENFCLLFLANGSWLCRGSFEPRLRPNDVSRRVRSGGTSMFEMTDNAQFDSLQIYLKKRPIDTRCVRHFSVLYLPMVSDKEQKSSFLQIDQCRRVRWATTAPR